ncbi:hypothetical protein GLOIN_2v1813362 [Rhizophagus clarus]|uniref:Uncharacterized protein n=1 Tax=Rhizophagus clarus TaxID=94130 RepID=A0A8H3MFN1_9GLOM|nr:hypothetical protein GLOIN_2v1813362 [Rhizophagus clarus]
MPKSEQRYPLFKQLQDDKKYSFIMPFRELKLYSYEKPSFDYIRIDFPTHLNHGAERCFSEIEFLRCTNSNDDIIVGLTEICKFIRELELSVDNLNYEIIKLIEAQKKLLRINLSRSLHYEAFFNQQYDDHVPPEILQAKYYTNLKAYTEPMLHVNLNVPQFLRNISTVTLTMRWTGNWELAIPKGSKYSDIDFLMFEIGMDSVYQYTETHTVDLNGNTYRSFQMSFKGFTDKDFIDFKNNNNNQHARPCHDIEQDRAKLLEELNKMKNDRNKKSSNLENEVDNVIGTKNLDNQDELKNLLAKYYVHMDFYDHVMKTSDV